LPLWGFPGIFSLMAQYRREGNFQLVSGFMPQGDQPQAIEKLVQGINEAKKH